jgi:predicted glycogen debranching enzyme
VSPLDRREWLEVDGLGGFAMGTVCTLRTRRYHGLLVSATLPPSGRMALVSGLEVAVEMPAGTLALSSQRYGEDVIHPDGASRIAGFETRPWPKWTYQLGAGATIEHELFFAHGAPVVFLSWRTLGDAQRGTLRVRPLLSARDMHALQHENASFRFDASETEGLVTWQPVDTAPEIVAAHDGVYAQDAMWFRNFEYDEEKGRGLDFVEDLGSPGVFTWDLSRGAAQLAFAAGRAAWESVLGGGSVATVARRLRDLEKRRRMSFASTVHVAANDYLVARGKGKTILAGYPWFGDWGRDTFIALRGLCLAAGRLDEARDILVEWAGTVSEGMLPNRFPDHGEAPEYNSVDASLWYAVAVFDYLRAARRAVSPSTKKTLWRAVRAILEGYAAGTRYGIRLDADGLIAAGVPGTPLTWMDARVDQRAVTPRIGKPVEIQALWLNALSSFVEMGGKDMGERWEDLFERGCDSFRKRFWNDERRCLYDVVDVDHEKGRVDASFRPNQIFAVGGLPLAIMDAVRSRRAVDQAFAKLWTPWGPRTLAPGEPGYCAHYDGGVPDRDGCYHQGTVWPWLAGPFVEAWLAARGRTSEAKSEARKRFLTPLLVHLDEFGLDHLCEIADAEPPHAPRGCPFQAWSVGELIRMAAMLDAPLVALLAHRDNLRRIAAEVALRTP